MGWFDDQLKKWRGEATKQAASAAASAAAIAAAASAATAASAAKKAVEAVGEDFLGFAERELARAEGERAGREPVKPGEAGEAAKAEAKPAAPPVRHATAKEREDRARVELERLKAAMKRPASAGTGAPPTDDGEDG